MATFFDDKAGSNRRRAPSEISVEYIDRPGFPPHDTDRRYEPRPNNDETEYVYRRREVREKSRSPSARRSRADSGYSSGAASSSSSSATKQQQDAERKKAANDKKSDTFLAVGGALAGSALVATAGKWVVEKARTKTQELEKEDSRRGLSHRNAGEMRGRRYSVSERHVHSRHPDGTSIHQHYRSRSHNPPAPPRRSSSSDRPAFVSDDEDDAHHVINNGPSEATLMRRERHLKNKQALMGGLAAVAAVHAAHLSYRGHEARKDRREAVKEGKMDERTARKAERHAVVQDLESLGVALLAVKNAVRSVKEARDIGDERRALQQDRRSRSRGDGGVDGRGRGRLDADDGEMGEYSRSRSRAREALRDRHNIIYTSEDGGP